MDPRLVNSLGLIFDIIGAYLVWHYGLPPDVNRRGTRRLLLEGVDQAEIQKAKRFDFRSSVGFVCLIIGFALQLVSNWVGR